VASASRRRKTRVDGPAARLRRAASLAEHAAEITGRPKKANRSDTFHKFATGSAKVMGSAWSFIIAVGVIFVWAVTGPLFAFSDTWQLVINTGTTIVTFLMVFLIQNTQNRDAKAIHLKLDELLRAVGDARTSLVDLEELSESELNELEQNFRQLQQKARRIEGKCPPK
jgi:low affinity Fe/Cu permease